MADFPDVRCPCCFRGRTSDYLSGQPKEEAGGGPIQGLHVLRRYEEMIDQSDQL